MFSYPKDPCMVFFTYIYHKKSTKCRYINTIHEWYGLWNMYSPKFVKVSLLGLKAWPQIFMNTSKQTPSNASSKATTLAFSRWLLSWLRQWKMLCDERVSRGQNSPQQTLLEQTKPWHEPWNTDWNWLVEVAGSSFHCFFFIIPIYSDWVGFHPHHSKTVNQDLFWSLLTFQYASLVSG